jgi:hypothetical protein
MNQIDPLTHAKWIIILKDCIMVIFKYPDWMNRGCDFEIYCFNKEYNWENRKKIRDRLYESPLYQLIFYSNSNDIYDSIIRNQEGMRRQIQIMEQNERKLKSDLEWLINHKYLDAKSIKNVLL